MVGMCAPTGPTALVCGLFPPGPRPAGKGPKRRKIPAARPAPPPDGLALYRGPLGAGRGTDFSMRRPPLRATAAPLEGKTGGKPGGRTA